MKYPDTYTIHLSKDYPVELDKLDIGDGFCIYSFDLCGECEWNRVAAKAGIAQSVNEKHIDIVNALKKRDADLARKTMYEHLQMVEDTLSDII